MALVVFLRGVNVGGHKTFRPSVIAKALNLDVVNIGAAGTFVIRKPISRAKLREEVLRRLPFDADVMMCDGAEILQLASSEPFAGQPSGSKILHFVSLMAKRRTSMLALPLVIPSRRDCAVKIFDVRGRFVLGWCRREMKAIGYLGQLEKVIGMPATMRSWNTFLRIAATLEGPGYNPAGG